MTLINISSIGSEKKQTAREDPSSPVLIPSYSHWFSPDSIHDIEKRNLPEFFSGDSTDSSGTYKTIRQFMIESYQNRPKEYLSVAFCRRMLSADIGAIYRVHSFLEQWGLINYHVNTNLTSSLPQQPSSYVYPKSRPHGQFEGHAPSRVTHQCVSCNTDCVQGFYSPVRSSSEIVICPECFADGKLPEGAASTDYAFHETLLSRIQDQKEWTEEEELKLLEAIEKFPSDWNKVAEAVDRSKEQCILRFLQLDTLNIDSSSITDDSKVSPFANLENPVIGTVAFLASLVHPKVAATAAKAAIAALSPDVSKTDVAASAAFSIAAAKAHEMAKEEGEIIQHLRDAIVLTQMKKVQLKLAYLESLEKNVLEEKAELEKQRMVLFLERVNLKKAIMGMEGRFVKKEVIDEHQAYSDPSNSIQSLSDNTK